MENELIVIVNVLRTRDEEGQTFLRPKVRLTASRCEALNGCADESKISCVF